MARPPRKSLPRLRYPTEEEVAAAPPPSPPPLEELRGKSVPGKLMDEKVREQLLIYAAYTSVENAARKVGVCAQAVYQLRHRDLEFDEKWKMSKASHVCDVEVAYLNQALRGNVEAIKGYLAAHKPEVYRPRSELELRAPVETVEIVKAAATFMREQRRLGVPVVEVVAEPSGNGGNGNGHKDSAAIVKAAGGNGASGS